MHAKVIIIGSGPAGYTAAIYAARANLSPIQFLGEQPGGQLTITTDVENFPGFSKPIQGPWLMEEMKAQAKAVGTTMIDKTILSVQCDVKPFVLKTADETYTADSIIIATGATAKWLGVKGEEHFRGFGVSACATCDGFFFKNKKVMVVGGGNAAVEEALFLTNFAESVTLVHRRDQLRAEKIAQDRLFKNPKISVIWNHVVEEVIGEDLPKKVKSVVLKNTKNNELQRVDIDGVFVAIGHTPQSSLFTKTLQLDEEAYILVEKGSTKTSVEGIYACGDVTDKVYRQAVTAAGMGCQAALDAERYLHTME